MCLSEQTVFNCRENKPKNGGICVANHTTPIDVIILANDGYYSMVEHFICICFCECVCVPFSQEWMIRKNDFAVCCIVVCKDAFLILLHFSWICVSGRTGARRVDGSGPKSHGQILCAHLVWKIRSQRQTPSGQEVTVHHLSVGVSLSLYSIMVSTTSKQPITMEHIHVLMVTSELYRGHV